MAQCFVRAKQQTTATTTLVLENLQTAQALCRTLSQLVLMIPPEDNRLIKTQRLPRLILTRMRDRVIQTQPFPIDVEVNCQLLFSVSLCFFRAICKFRLSLRLRREFL
ncbi:hypothetical protein RvY_15103-1 [Ramazzottius varieornatus]|uniref:Uncharacterized protein n=1 Tax=Ramazzottius varieornatus TaxID=947166 RepID=A0A1D1VTP8_RAMVA|nr:hypothetical protein RvY_15103-1 [Ramazzottius varieornatus]